MKHRFLARLLATVLIAESVVQFAGPLPVHADGDIRIDEEHFPDAAFRQVIRQKYDTIPAGGDGYLNEQELGVYNIVCEEIPEIKSLDGIEYFTEVRGVWCKDCDIDHLDLSNNTKVTGVWCSGNKRLTSLEFSNNKDLEWLYCHDCNITYLDVTHNDKLAYLECNTNVNLGSLDVTHNPNLEHLTCGTCGLSELDLRNNTILTHLDAFQNNFSSLDLTHNTKLVRLDIWNNPELGNMDVSIFPDLEYYNCASNGVTVLDVSHNPNLMMLNCAWNGIHELNLGNNHRLAWLRCMDNPISSLDLSNNPQLYFCQVVNTNITTLDISNNTRLIKVLKDGTIDTSEADGINDDWVINYGGSTDYFDDLRYWFIAGNNVAITGLPAGNAKYTDNGDRNYYDCFIDTDDQASGDLVTRGEAIQTLYDLAGRPGYNGSGADRFSDLNGEFYEAAAIWGAEHNIALGYPNVYSDTFAGDKPIAKQDLALMIHRYAQAYGYSSAYDYGRTDHFVDSLDIDFYAWGAYTYAIQWEILPVKGDHIYPHGRTTTQEFSTGLRNFLDHCEIKASATVCTLGGNGTLQEQDIDSRHYTNHSDPFGMSVQMPNTGAGNQASGSVASNPQTTAQQAVENAETLQQDDFATGGELATITNVTELTDEVKNQLVETTTDLVHNNDSVDEIHQIFLADVTVNGSDGDTVSAYVGKEYAGQTAYAYRYNGTDWELNGVVEISGEGYATENFDGYSQIAFMVVKEKEEESSSKEEKPAHVHHFAWVVTEEPSHYRLGLELYRCEECGKVLDERTIDNMRNVFKEIRNKVNNAPQNGTVKVDTGSYISLNGNMVDTLKNRSDVTINFVFTYKEQKYDMVIPAGFNWDYTQNSSGWVGFMYLGSFPGVTLTPVTK